MATFTTVSKTKTNWESPSSPPAVDIDYFLNIGSGFNLLIATGHKLVVGVEAGDRTETPWTGVTKDKTNY